MIKEGKLIYYNVLLNNHEILSHGVMTNVFMSTNQHISET